VTPHLDEEPQVADSPDTTLSPTTISARGLIRRSPLTDLNAPDGRAGGQAPYVYPIPARDLPAVVDYGPALASTVDTAPSTRHIDLERDREMAPGTPARNAYLDARAQAGAVGIALADPRMRRALILARLERDQTRIASSLPKDYDAARKPPVWRVRERSEWERHHRTVRALDANAEWQEHLRTELGPDSEQITRRAVALAEAREQILARTPELQRNAIDEELAREPEWLTETLGPRPEVGAGHWQTLAAQLAANRMRFLVADDADPGIRPEQSQLAQQVAQFRAEARLAQSVTLAPGVGLGM
jgi:hypothetical protein